MADSVDAIFFAAHADDIELSCGATIVKMVPVINCFSRRTWASLMRSASRGSSSNRAWSVILRPHALQNFVCCSV